MAPSNGSGIRGDGKGEWQGPAVGAVGFLKISSFAAGSYTNIPSATNQPNFPNHWALPIHLCTPRGDHNMIDFPPFLGSNFEQSGFHVPNAPRTSLHSYAALPLAYDFVLPQDSSQPINRFINAPGTISNPEDPAENPSPTSDITNGDETSEKRHSSAEWNERKDEIGALYKKFSLPVLQKKMKARGFYASESMYKRRFKTWGWKKYKISTKENLFGRRSKNSESCKPSRPSKTGRRSKNNKSYRPSTPSKTGRAVQQRPVSQESFGQLARRASTSSPSTVMTPETPSDQSSWSAVASPTFSIRSYAGPKIARPLTVDEKNRLFTEMLQKDESLYSNGIQNGEFNVMNAWEVLEDEHDDLLVNVAVSLRSLKILDNSSAHKGIHEAFRILKKVTGNQEGGRCGFFSLPAIWESYLRLIREEELKMAACFLSKAIGHARERFPKNHFFVQSLVLLKRLEAEGASVKFFEEVIVVAYNHCRVHVGNILGSSNLSYLSLWADFVAYHDNSSAPEVMMAINNLQKSVPRSDGGDLAYDDYTLKFIGMTLYVFQAMRSRMKGAEASAEATAKAKETAYNLHERVEKRLEETGERLEGELLDMWKDLQHTFGDFRHVEGDNLGAVAHMISSLLGGLRHAEGNNLSAVADMIPSLLGSLGHVEWGNQRAVMRMLSSLHGGVADERDIYTLQKLKEYYYLCLGDVDEAELTRRLRLGVEHYLFDVDVATPQSSPEDILGQFAQISVVDGAEEMEVMSEASLQWLVW